MDMLWLSDPRGPFNSIPFFTMGMCNSEQRRGVIIGYRMPIIFLHEIIRGRRLAAWLLTLVASLVSTGCSRPQPQLPTLGVNATVLAFGDSITRGNGATAKESYPAVLGELIGRRVINAGKAGELSRDGLRRLPGLMASYHPRLVILTHGGNDFLRRIDERETEENIRQMIGLIQKQGASVILVGVPAPGIMLTPPGLYERLAEQFNLPYEKEVLPYIYRRGSLKSDAIHPNAHGYRELAQSIAQMLREGGALE